MPGRARAATEKIRRPAYPPLPHHNTPPSIAYSLTTITMACSTVQLLSRTIRGSSDAALIVDEIGMILAQNSPADKLFGTSASAESEPSSSSQNISSQLVFSAGARSWSEVASSLGDAEQSCNVIILQSDGEKLTGSARLSKLTDGTVPTSNGNQLFVIYVCALDTSRSKIWSDANELRRLKRIQDTVDASFDAMFTIDSEGTILLLNDAAILLFGYDYNELLGEPISKICGGDHAAKHQQYIENYVSDAANFVAIAQMVYLPIECISHNFSPTPSFSSSAQNWRYEDYGEEARSASSKEGRNRVPCGAWNKGNQH